MCLGALLSRFVDDRRRFAHFPAVQANPPANIARDNRRRIIIPRNKGRLGANNSVRVAERTSADIRKYSQASVLRPYAIVHGRNKS